MKKSTKICLIIAAVLTAIGIALCVIAGAVGGTWGSFVSFVRDGGMNFGPYDWHIGDFETADFQKKFDDIEELEVEIGLANLEIVEGDGDAFIFTADDVMEHTKVEEKNGKLIIKEKGHKVIGIPTGDYHGHMLLEVPKGTIFKDISIEAGIGSVTVQDVETKELEIDCGIGEVSYDGKLTKKADIKCGMGQITMALAGEADAFDYDVDCGAGEVTIGGESYSGLGTTKKINNSGNGEIDIECGMGQVDISFK